MRRSTQFALMAIHVACAAGTYVLSKLAADGFRSPEALTLARALGTTFVLLALTGTLIPRPNFDGPTWAKLLGLGILHVPINQYLFLRGLKASVPSHGALMYALTPLGVLLFTSWLERAMPRRAKLLGVLVALAGAVVVLEPWEGGAEAAKVRGGDLLLLAAVAAWVFCTVATRALSRRHDPRTVTAWTLILGTLATMPIGGLALKQTDFAQVPASAWLGLAYMVVITSVTMNLLWSQLLKHLHPVQVAVCMNAQPPATALLQSLLAIGGPAWLGATIAPPLAWPFWVGMALVLLGVIVGQRSGRIAAAPPAAPR